MPKAVLILRVPVTVRSLGIVTVLGNAKVILSPDLVVEIWLAVPPKTKVSVPITTPGLLSSLVSLVLLVVVVFVILFVVVVVFVFVFVSLFVCVVVVL